MKRGHWNRRQVLSAAGALSVVPIFARASEKIIGDIISAGNPRDALFLATKVWASGREAGISQMRRSAELMNADVIDLMQVHNLRDTDIHLHRVGGSSF